MSFADSAAAVDAPWPELDRCFLQKDRRAPPPFPLDVIAAAWRPWIEGHAQASTCTDYIAQGLLAAVSAVCGSRTVVDVTPHWREPLVLWQALVGAPSTGKTAALVAARRLLAGVKAPPDTFTDGGKPDPDGFTLTAWMMHRGISSWYDDLGAWLAKVSRDREECGCAVHGWTGDPADSGGRPFDVGQSAARVPKSVFGACRADRLAELLGEVDDAMLSRFLYCWPVPGLEARLDRADGGEEDARRLLQRLVDLPGEREEPATLALHAAATARLQDLLPQLRAFMRDTEGLEAAWIGKAAGTIVRLAGLLSLMDWAAGGGETPCTTVEERQLERAHALWTDYYWPHAQMVFGQASLTIDERRVRRVGHWLRRMRLETVSREEVRREALCQTVDAAAAERVIERLERYGAVRMLPIVKEARRGPHKLRWQVNPDLWAN